MFYAKITADNIFYLFIYFFFHQLPNLNCQSIFQLQGTLQAAVSSPPVHPPSAAGGCTPVTRDLLQGVQI